MARLDRLDASQVAAVLALASAADDADGAHPLSEQLVLRLRAGAVPGIHLLAGPHALPTGYGHVADDGSGEIVVHPVHRRRGAGRALVGAAVDAVRERAGAGPLRLWAHGDHPSAAALALSLGFERHRVLLQLRRPLIDPPDPPSLPPGISLRAFRPGDDDQRWLAANAAAFAGHPEQGSWTDDDLRLRKAEPWFDPAGFLLAVRDTDGELLGFHWTKVHDGRPSAAAHAGGDGNAARAADRSGPTGEVYVLGVTPSAQGTGLGTALALAGLRHLHRRGLRRVMLYVDEDNTAAVRLYRRLGFRRWTTHISYRRP